MTTNYYADMFDLNTITPRDELHELVDTLDDDLIPEATAMMLELMGK